MLLPPAPNTCHPRRYSNTSYSICPMPRLDYRNAVLAGLPASTLAPFHRVLHAAAARTVLDLKPRDHVTPAVQELHWVPVAERIQYKLCLLVHKSLEYISNLLMPFAEIQGRPTLGASSRGNLVVPRTRQLIADRALCCRPASVEQATDTAQTAAIDGLVSA